MAVPIQINGAPHLRVPVWEDGRTQYRDILLPTSVTKQYQVRQRVAELEAEYEHQCALARVRALLNPATHIRPDGRVIGLVRDQRVFGDGRVRDAFIVTGPKSSSYSVLRYGLEEAYALALDDWLICRGLERRGHVYEALQERYRWYSIAPPLTVTPERSEMAPADDLAEFAAGFEAQLREFVERKAQGGDREAAALDKNALFRHGSRV